MAEAGHRQAHNAITLTTTYACTAASITCQDRANTAADTLLMLTIQAYMQGMHVM